MRRLHHRWLQRVLLGGATVACATFPGLVYAMNADLSISKIGPASIVRGHTLSYTITVTNLGPDQALNVAVIDPIPSGLTFNATASSVSCSVQGTNVVCNVGSIPTGNVQAVTISFDVPTIPNCTESTVLNHALVTTTSADPNLNNNNSNTTQTTLKCPKADLTILKDGPAEATIGDVVLYTVKVVNKGPDRAEDILVEDVFTFPASLLAFPLGSSSECSLDLNADTVICSGFDLEPNESTTLTLAFLVSDPSLDCEERVLNRATVESFTPDPVAQNNSSELIGTIMHCPEADLVIEKQGPPVADESGEISYTLVITNEGPDAAHDVSVTDSFSFNGQLLSSSSPECEAGPLGVTHCSGFDLLPGESIELILDFSYDPLTECGKTFVNEAEVTSLTIDPNPRNNSDEVVTETDCNLIDLSTTKVGQAIVNLGKKLTYTVTVKNHGPTVAQNIVVKDSIPSGLIFVPAESSTECTHPAGEDFVQCEIVSMGLSGTAELTLTFQTADALTCGDLIQNVATVSADGLDINDSNNTSDPVQTGVQCPAPPTGCLDIVKETFDPDGRQLTPVPQFTFTLDGGDTVQNNGAGRATFYNVKTGKRTVTEVVPQGWQLISVTPDGGTVTVQEGPTCATVVFKNKQIPPTAKPLTITKTDGKVTAAPGEELTYTMTVRNPNDSAAENVTVMDVLPSLVTFVEASDNGSHNDQKVTWTGLSVSASGTLTLTVKATVRSDAKNGNVLTNVAQIKDGSSAQDQTTVKVEDIPIEQSKVSIDIRDQKDPVEPTENVCYEIIVSNGNQKEIPNAVVTQILDGLTTFVSASDNGVGGHIITWTLTLPPGETRLHSCARLSDTADDEDSLVSTAKVFAASDKEQTGIEEDRDDDDHHVIHEREDNLEIFRRYDIAARDFDPGDIRTRLTVDKQASTREASPGSIVSYKITVKNLSDFPTRELVVSDRFTVGQVEITDAGGGRIVGNGIEWFDIVLAPDQTRVLTYQARVSQGMQHGQVITNVAEVQGPDVEGQLSDTVNVNIITQLPQTGLGFSHWRSARSALLGKSHPVVLESASASGSIPFIAWTSFIGLGLSVGGVIGRRML